MSVLAAKAAEDAKAVLYQIQFDSEGDTEIYVRAENLLTESAHRVVELAHQKFGSLVADDTLLVIVDALLQSRNNIFWTEPTRKLTNRIIYAARNYQQQNVLGDAFKDGDLLSHAECMLNVLYTQNLHDLHIVDYFRKTNVLMLTDKERDLVHMYVHLYENPGAFPYYEAGMRNFAQIQLMIDQNIEPNLASALGGQS